MGRATGRLTGNYYLRRKRSGQDEQILYLRYFVCGKYVEHSTGIKLLPSQWDAKDQKVNNTNPEWKRINAELESMKVKFDNKILSYDGTLTASMLSELLAGELVEKKDLKKTTDFIAYSLEYNKLRYDGHKISYSTWDNARLYILAFQRYVESVTGSDKIMMCDVNKDIFDRYINWRLNDKKNSRAGINKMLAPMYLAAKYAADNELLSLKVASSIYTNYLDEKDRNYTGELNEGKVRYLTPQQLQSFVDLYPTVSFSRTRDFMDMFLFSFHACGLRVSDVITLEWSHIDLKKKVITKSMFKTKAAINIPLTDPAVEILNRWKGRYKRFVFGMLPEDFNLKNAAALKNARLSKNRTIQQSLKSVGEKIGLNFNLTMHVARHTFAVMALKEGVDLHLISKLMGHASILVTEKVYAEFMPSQVDQEVRSKLTFNYKFS